MTPHDTFLALKRCTLAQLIQHMNDENVYLMQELKTYVSWPQDYLKPQMNRYRVNRILKADALCKKHYWTLEEFMNHIEPHLWSQRP